MFDPAKAVTMRSVFSANVTFIAAIGYFLLQQALKFQYYILQTILFLDMNDVFIIFVTYFVLQMANPVDFLQAVTH